MVYRFPAQRPADVSDATLLDKIKAQITHLPTYGYPVFLIMTAVAL